MTPAARVQAAIDLIDAWRTGDLSLDRLLANWGRRNRYAGSGDRRAIADLVHQALRCKRSAAWRAGTGDDATGRQIVHGLMLAEAQDVQAFFTGDRHAPAALGTEEISARRGLQSAPYGVRYDFPDWLASDFAELAPNVLTSLQSRAPLDLRVNPLRAELQDAVAALADEGILTQPVADVPTALRVIDGDRKLRNCGAYQTGKVEIQDAASQRIAALCAARPGETVLDLCAGGGGKTLAIAAQMGNIGRLLAHDIEPRRIAGLSDRAARAGAKVDIVESSALDRLKGRCDLVLVDAPCSGSGTWRRNPDEKWRLTPERLAKLTAIQDKLLAQAETLVAPGGRIVYATCSLLAVENDDRVDHFTGARPSRRLGHSERLLPGCPGDGMFSAEFV